jgi:5-methylcytosine-specific restriction protein A
VQNDGGLIAAKSWLRLKKSDVATGGFLKLVEFGRLDLSLEAQVIKKRWSSLFTPEELEVARSRLARYGYFDKSQPTRRDPIKLPEEVETQLEGKTKTITVNAYERSAKARAACLKEYGRSCYVCGFSFAEGYGPEAAKIVHVHHLVPIASVGEEYEVDPIADLRPVCPNCHAVIHMTNPPKSIDEVRKMLKRKK